MAGHRKFGSGRLFLSVLGVVTWVVTAASTVYTILDAASLAVAGLSFRGLGIAAASLDVVSLCCVGLFLMQYAWKKDGIWPNSKRLKQTLALTCITLSAVSLIMSLITLIVIKQNHDEVSRKTTRNWTDRLPAKFAVWATSCITQMALYSFTLVFKRVSSNTSNTFVQQRREDPRDSVMPEMHQQPPSTDMQTLAPLHAHKESLGSLPSPTFSTRSSQSLRSWRESLQQVVRPVTSRTKLIRSSISQGRDSRSVHSDGQSFEAIQNDGFDAWDTSSVDPQTQNAIMAAIPFGLETIPGSRPASPAHALDGPFVDSPSGRSSPALSLPPKIYTDYSRPPSPAVSEAHIHPLFRTDSPTPAPAATPGTIVHASPMSGSIITCPPRMRSNSSMSNNRATSPGRLRSDSRTNSPARMRSNSLAASPSPLAHSKSFPTGSSSRTPSPPSREMTPPIPDFILTSSPRSSYGGGSARPKISLQADRGRALV
ncbi:uncharacterized protein BDZ99DRAFT_279681 [Mytilinidion resinicola]|uniref:Uncharacterized protein n=1 Tax=Mytilinidion resinicola TaxID=574789 RepID=A0A6A6YS06_9PEZI|nr:uncharacterized protein BDZ99DRAFT_279681 [Mytilinidion resinicola]KAF2811712.1 hypothetical protein BDZ99DRAFT_279681 [Mytilinidion resinicola]